MRFIYLVPVGGTKLFPVDTMADRQGKARESHVYNFVYKAFCDGHELLQLFDSLQK